MNPLKNLLIPTVQLLATLALQAGVEDLPWGPVTHRWVSRAVSLLVILLLLRLFRMAVLLIIEQGRFRTIGDSTLQSGFIPLIRNLANLVTFVFGAILILRLFGYDVVSLLAALGVGSLAVGLAAQPTLSNMISGFTLIIDRNLKPGDRLTLAGFTGEVEEIGLRSTRIRTSSGKSLIVPNSELVNTRILNLSLPTRKTGISIPLKLSLGTSFPDFQKLCAEALAACPSTSQAEELSVLLAGVTETAIQAQVGFTVSEPELEARLTSEFLEALLEKLPHSAVRLAQLP